MKKSSGKRLFCVVLAFALIVGMITGMITGWTVFSASAAEDVNGKKETERKWLINEIDIPYDLSSADVFEIDQSYISFDPEIRVRKIENRGVIWYMMSVKANMPASTLTRDEAEYFISEESYNFMLAKKEGNTIYKTRHQVKIDGITRSIDIFKGNLAGLAYLETEYASEDQAMQDDSQDWWVIKDVSSDKRYKNQSLARYGIPEELTSSKTSDTSSPDESSQTNPDSAKSIVMCLNSVKALLGNTEIAVDPSNAEVSPFTLFGKTMVPVRFVQQLGADVKYDGMDAPVTVTYGDISLALEFGNSVMKKKVGNTASSDIVLPTAPAVVEGKTCVPIREVAEGLGFFVKYDDNTHVIVVSATPLPEPELNELIKSGKSRLPTFIEAVRGIMAKKTSFAAKIGEVVQLDKSDIIFDPVQVGCGKLVYTSDNKNIATVTSNGRIKAIAKGTANITVSSHNGKTAEIMVSVMPDPAHSQRLE